MKEIIVNTQEELDAIKQDFGGIIKIVGIGIRVGLRYHNRVEARENASVEAWDNASVEARENASVVARENASVVARGNACVVARENASVVARGNASVEAWGNASVVAWGNASVVAWDNASVEAWENASVEAWGNASVVAWGNVCVRIAAAIRSLSLFGLSVLFKPFDLKFKFTKEKTVCVQDVRPMPYLERNGVPVGGDNVILYKRVSGDYKTQEGTENETLWAIGSTVTHPAWQPACGECGAGKFHAVSRPYFADEFRSKRGDRYVAIRIKVADLYEWENPTYPHKVAFREGTVLYECDRFGKKIVSQARLHTRPKPSDPMPTPPLQ